MSASKFGPLRKCRRCGLRKMQHVIDDKCADGRVFYASAGSKLRASGSFNADELHVLDVLMKNATLGRDSRVISRNPAFSRLARKTMRMLERLVKLNES